MCNIRLKSGNISRNCYSQWDRKRINAMTYINSTNIILQKIIIPKNKTKTIYDIDTSLAKEHETSLLTKQRYYVYIIWFIILAIILYITISNIFNPESSFSVLLISLILLICIFLFFM